MKKNDLPLTLTRQILFDIRIVLVCLCLFITISASGQEFQLHRTWDDERIGNLDRPKCMAVQRRGHAIAVARQYESTFEVFLYDETMTEIWSESFSREGESPGTRRQVIAIAFSETQAALYVLAKQGDWYGLLIKYDMADGEVIWSQLIDGNYPEVLLPTADGDIVVGGFVLNPAVFSVSPMFVAKYSSSFFEGERWREDYEIGEAVTAPSAITASPDGQTIYITGTATRNRSEMENSRHVGFPSRMFTAALNIENGHMRWHMEANGFARFLSGHGYDIEPLNDGVAVLGQVVERTADGISSTVLIGYATADGHELFRVDRPSAWRQYPDLIRNNLARDVSTDELYIAYPLTEMPNLTHVVSPNLPNSRAAVEKYNRDLLVWSRTDWPDTEPEPTEVRSLSYSTEGGNLFVGIYFASLGSNQIQVISSANDHVATGRLRAGNEFNQLELIRLPFYSSDASLVFSSGSIGSSDGFAERYQLIPALPPFPWPLQTVGHVSSDILDEHAWRIDALCSQDEPCVDVAIEAHALQFGKEIWNKKFNKSTEIMLSPTDIPTTYGIKWEVNKIFQEVITMDESLFSSGVKGVHIETDTKGQSLTIKSTTDGQQVPFKLTLLNSLGKTIKEYALTAPDQNVITDQQEEQVARLLLSADNPFNMTAYPNPSKGEFTVSTGNQKESTTSVSIIDMSGFKIYQGAIPSGEKLVVKLSSPKPGLYVLIVKNGSYERRQFIEIKY